jgi:anti-anti-sigma factor
MKAITCEIKYNDDTLKIKLVGEIDHHSARSVREEIDKEMFLRRAKTVLMDLSGIEFMDSSGLGLILGRYSNAGQLGGKLKLVNPSKNVMKILELAGTEKMIPVEFTKEAAKA